VCDGLSELWGAIDEIRTRLDALEPVQCPACSGTKRNWVWERGQEPSECKVCHGTGLMSKLAAASYESDLTSPNAWSGREADGGAAGNPACRQRKERV
jgi:hypothetical protein